MRGMKTSGELCALWAPVNPRGLTPTIVTGIVFTLMTLPRTFGEPPKLRCQNASLMVATAPVPGAPSSEDTMARPRAGFTCSSS